MGFSVYIIIAEVHIFPAIKFFYIAHFGITVLKNLKFSKIFQFFFS